MSKNIAIFKVIITKTDTKNDKISALFIDKCEEYDPFINPLVKRGENNEIEVTRYIDTRCDDNYLWIYYIDISTERAYDVTRSKNPTKVGLKIYETDEYVYTVQAYEVALSNKNKYLDVSCYRKIDIDTFSDVSINAYHITHKAALSMTARYISTKKLKKWKNRFYSLRIESIIKDGLKSIQLE